MSMQPRPFPPLPQSTALVARRALRKGNTYLTIGDRIGQIYQDEDFQELYALEGPPALSPAQLVLVLIFQALEGLSDREAADAVRARIDWKYALHLALEDMGFDFSVLSEFRDRLVAHQAGQRVLDRVLERMRTLELLKERGQQRTDSTHVLSVARTLNRLELVMETIRLALEEVAEVAPRWLQAVALPDWVERYALAWRSSRLPRSQEGRAELAALVGGDGAHLLQAIRSQGAPEGLLSLPTVQLLTKVWEQQYESGAQGWRWRPVDTLPTAAELIQTPHDPEAGYADRRGQAWTGYRAHFTETCDQDCPRLITHVEVTTATQPDVVAVEPIHQALQQRDCLPQDHLLDGGYMAGHTLVDSQKNYGVQLIGPVAGNTTWQAKQEGAFTPDMFQIDWEQERVTCPTGQVSSTWSHSHNQYGHPVIHVRFSRAGCQACLSRSSCTRAKAGRSLQLRPDSRALAQAREQQTTEAFRKKYAARAGIEGTISATVRRQGARTSRYVGLQKTWLQDILLATAINVERAARWLMGQHPAKTRTSHFIAIMQAA